MGMSLTIQYSDMEPSVGGHETNFCQFELIGIVNESCLEVGKPTQLNNSLLNLTYLLTTSYGSLRNR